MEKVTSVIYYDTPDSASAGWRYPLSAIPIKALPKFFVEEKGLTQ